MSANASTSAVPALPALDNTMGALYLSIIFAMGLWGVGTVQMFNFFDTYRTERWQLKLLVFVVWSLDTAHQGMITHAGYVYLVTHYADPAFLNTIVSSLELMVVISAFVVILVQAFLIYRVWMLSHKSLPLALFLALLSLLEFSATIAYYIRGSRLGQFTLVATQIGWLCRLVNGLGAGADTAIALALVWLLLRSRTGFSRSDGLIRGLILWAVNTGLVTSVFAVLTVVFVTVFPFNFIYITMYMCISRLYTNALLATLNHRQAVRSAFNTEVKGDSSYSYSPNSNFDFGGDFSSSSSPATTGTATPSAMGKGGNNNKKNALSVIAFSRSRSGASGRMTTGTVGTIGTGTTGTIGTIGMGDEDAKECASVVVTPPPPSHQQQILAPPKFAIRIDTQTHAAYDYGGDVEDASYALKTLRHRANDDDDDNASLSASERGSQKATASPTNAV